MFRNDINGLRAIAVLVVVLFHFNVDWMPGGFIGVDIFFVISGFLMTGVIFRGIEENNFSILKFYIARANRIIPALSFLCFVLFIFGWFYFTPIDFKMLGKHLFGSIAFLSNFMYWKEAGYFAAASHEKWLLHTWSLSVEWQFYIIYPLMLILMSKFILIKVIKNIILLGAGLGFVFSVVATYKWPDAAYYLLPTRAWEMLLGGVAYLYPLTLKLQTKKYLEWFGFILIISSFTFISQDNYWPGYLALIPTLGSFFIIQAQRNDSVITSNIVFQKLGQWSYSIYLWHWPIVVGIYSLSLNDEFIYIGIALSIALGFLSYKYIEKIKFKNNFLYFFEYIKMKPFYMVLIIGGLGCFIFITNGFELRSKNVQYSFNNMSERLKSNYGLSKKCSNSFTLSDKCRTDNVPEILVWGDSFSMHLVNGILASNPKAKIIQMTKSNCGPFFNVAPIKANSFADKCLEFTKNVRKWLESNSSVKYVVMSSPFTLYYSDNAKVKMRSGEVKTTTKDEINKYFEQTLNELYKLGVVPVIFSPPPSTGSNIGKCLDRASFFGSLLSDCDFNESSITKSQQDIYNWLLELEKKFRVIRLNNYLCSDNKCKTHLDNFFIYRDKGHLSVEGSVKLGKEIGFYNLIVGAIPEGKHK